MSTEERADVSNVSEFIAENFGANATYVESLLARWQSDPSLVEESWRSYFEELLGPNGDGSTAATQAAPTRAESVERDGGGAATAPAKAQKPAPPAVAPAADEHRETLPIRGPALKIVENMEASLSVPTATSQRRIPVRLLDENRRIINRHLEDAGKGKASYTHLIAFALLRALEQFPQMNDGFEVIDEQPMRVKREAVNLGIAIDLEKKDGTRSLLVPNVKHANQLSFSQFLNAYDDVVVRARNGKLQISDFQGTTISLTNPGTIGTVSSTPRLMAGQSVIIATGAIEYPAEYQSIAPAILPQLGISKSITISSTYDHRIIQGAESGSFLARVHESLIGKHRFYHEVFADLGIPHLPLRWAIDRNPFLLGADETRAQT